MISMMVQIKPIMVDVAAAAMVVSLSESTLQSMVRQGNFPAPRKMSERRVGWLMREIEEWAENRPISDLPPPANTGAKKPQALRQPRFQDDQKAA